MFNRSIRFLYSSLFLLMFAFFCLTAQRVVAQSNYWPDSLKRELAHAVSLQEKVRWSASLARYYFAVDTLLSEHYARQAIEAAEMSRDRMLMIKTYINLGDRFMANGGLSGNVARAMEDYRQAEQIAKAENLEAGLVYTDCAMSRAFRSMGDYDRSLAYGNQAITTAGDGDNDTLEVMAYSTLGHCYLRRNEKLLAFRNYLKALDVAEQAKDDGLIRGVSDDLGDFYENIHEYDKAIDYGLREIWLDRKMRHFEELINDYVYVGIFFSEKKEFDIATGMFEHSIALADSAHFDELKLNAYISIFQMYFNEQEDYKRGMGYLNLHPEVTNYIDNTGMHFVIDDYYASAYSAMHRFDSAEFFFRSVAPQMESKGGPFVRAGFYDRFGGFYKAKGEEDKAMVYYLKESDLGRSIGDLSILQRSALNLDSLYLQKGDYRSAYAYHTKYVRYTDSLRSLAREADLLKLEVDNDNRRRERQVKEDELSREHRHNVQYMGFTAGLLLLFIALVMMGWLAVPPSVIRALGFLSFIFLFEFIILLADKTIQAWTHEEPWKILLIKIGLAAVLVPLHHWLEHNVIHYLSHRKRFGAGHRGKVAGEGARQGG
jgi:tetratricopeptide (TPR) repeat protein